MNALWKQAAAHQTRALSTDVALAACTEDCSRRREDGGARTVECPRRASSSRRDAAQWDADGQRSSARRPSARAEGAPVIELAAVEKTYPSGTRALAPIDLVIRGREFVTLLGPSGCGKSTLLRLAAGLDAPSAGRLRWWGQGFETVGRPGQHLAMVFQQATLMPWARVAANVRLPLDLARADRPAADRAVAAALELVGLAPFAASYPRELSGGMQMRVSIARALVTDPDLLLMDEPFGALDEITRYRLDREISDLWDKRRPTVVFVTHSVFESVYLSTRIAVMRRRPGRIVADLPVELPQPRERALRTMPSYAAICR